MRLLAVCQLQSARNRAARKNRKPGWGVRSWKTRAWGLEEPGEELGAGKAMRRRGWVCGTATPRVCWRLMTSFPPLFNIALGTSLVVQWLRIHLAIRGCGFDPWLEAKIPTCHGATNPQSSNYWACALWSPPAAMKDPVCCNQDPTQPSKY